MKTAFYQSCFWVIGCLLIAVLFVTKSSAKSFSEEDLKQLLGAEQEKSANDEKRSEKKADDTGSDSKSKQPKIKDRFKWQGDLRFAFRYANASKQVKDDLFGFELVGLNLEFQYLIRAGLEVKADVKLEPSGLDLQKAFVEITDQTAFFDRILMGLKDRLFEIDSGFETDTLNKIAFTRMQDNGIRGRIRFLDDFYFEGELANGGRLDDRDISLRRASKQDVILSDDFDPRQASGTNSRELIMALGYRIDNSKDAALRRLWAMFFMSTKSVSDEDVEDLETLADIPDFTGVQAGNTNYAKTGANLTFRISDLRSYSQVIASRVRDLDRLHFSTEWSYDFGHWRPMFAYSQQTHSVDPTPIEPLTWERQRYSLGVRKEWVEDARISVEWTINEEDTGGESVENDEFLVLWRFDFS